MACYALGDIHGCYTELQQLLELIHFDPTEDRLWLVGDLVNRGPQSLAVLNFLYQIRDHIQLVLGNHDLYLLAFYLGAKQPLAKDTVTEILESSNNDQLCGWLLQQPLFHYDSTLNFALVHAGIPEDWDCAKAIALNNEICAVLQNRSLVHEFMQNLSGNEPAHWDDSLKGWDRLRYIANAFTRMRFVDANGGLDFVSKHTINQQAAGSLPWFTRPQRQMQSIPILFGHWAALNGQANTPNVYALDTGCVWGNRLTALRLDDKTFYSVPSQQRKRGEK